MVALYVFAQETGDTTQKYYDASKSNPSTLTPSPLSQSSHPPDPSSLPSKTIKTPRSPRVLAGSGFPAFLPPKRGVRSHLGTETGPRARKPLPRGRSRAGGAGAASQDPGWVGLGLGSGQVRPRPWKPSEKVQQWYRNKKGDKTLTRASAEPAKLRKNRSALRQIRKKTGGARNAKNWGMAIQSIPL